MGMSGLWECQGGCDRRSEVIVKNQKQKSGGGGGGGFRSGWM